MKGDHKRRRAGFKKGNKHFLKSQHQHTCYVEEEEVVYSRPSSEDDALLRDPPLYQKFFIPHAARPSHRHVVLRARKSPVNIKKPDPADVYKLFHVQKLWAMVNTVTREHQDAEPGCRGDLKFNEAVSQQRGLVWSEKVMCSSCHYTSDTFPLYSEIKTYKKGRRPATANIGFNVALTQTPISATSAIKLLLGANIPAPSKSTLINTSTKVNETIKMENLLDMRKRREQLKSINRLRNMPEHEVAVEADGQYNNNLYSGIGRTPFQPATQSSYIVAENMTNQKQIIALSTVNKLCSKRGFHSDPDTVCDIKSKPCSATTTMETTIDNEQMWAESCFRELKSDGLEIRYLTTDPDTKSFQAAAELYATDVTTTKPIHLLDTRHLTENHRKCIKNNTLVVNMMPGKTKAFKQALCNRFSTDISRRCHSELECSFKNELGQLDKIKARIHKCILAMKKCYSANHSLCKTHSYVCKGTIKDNWISNSCYLPDNFKIDTNNISNEKILLECIEYRLSDNTLELTRLNSNSQKVEATNRSLRRSLPKNVTFSRNFAGRAHSAIHSVNNGPGQSLRKLCAVTGCPIPYGGRVDRHLSSLQAASEKKKISEKSIKFKIKRKLRRNSMFKLYQRHQEQTFYKKAQLLKDWKLKQVRPRTVVLRSKRPTSRSSDDHAYHRIPQNNQCVRPKKHGGSCPPKQAPAAKQWCLDTLDACVSKTK